MAHFQYPEVYIPSLFEQAKRALPPAPPEPTQPEKPEKPKRFPWSWLARLIPIGLFVGVFLNWAIAILAILGINALAGWLTYSRRMEEYRQEIARQNDRFQKERDRYRRQIDRQRTPEATARYQKERLSMAFQQTRLPDGQGSDAKSGTSESFFAGYLHHYFPEKIHAKVFLNIPNYPHPYTPDFCYYNGPSSFCIDIEIDEPYIGDTKKPWHYLGFRKDEKRNDFFLQRNWIIIRFAEEQICRQPISCCKCIAQVIEEMTGEPVPPQLSIYPDVFRVEKWTYQQAQQMAYGDYRDRYLNRLNL